MTKKETAMMEEMMNTIKSLTERIEKLEKQNKGLIVDIKGMTSTSRTETVKTEPVSQKSTAKTVGNLIFDGKYVKTGTGYMTSKTRYAINMAITERFGGTKLGKGNPVYDKCRKEDKYVQVYEFKTIADCKKFMSEQEKRVG